MLIRARTGRQSEGFTSTIPFCTGPLDLLHAKGAFNAQSDPVIVAGIANTNPAVWK
jgi:hypothetical protein